MMLIEETAVPSEALPVDAFKAHLRLGTGFSEDTLQEPVLESFLRAAMSAIEARTGKILIERDFSWTLTAWRDETGQALPVAPVTALEELVFVWVLKILQAVVQNLKIFPFHALLFVFGSNLFCVFPEDNSHLSEHLGLEVSFWHFESWNCCKKCILILKIGFHKIN